MTTDPRAALDRFIAALEAHFEIASSVQDPASPAVDDAASAVEDAFFTYDDALYTSYEVEVPLEAYGDDDRSEEHTSELQSRGHLVCRLLLEKKKPKTNIMRN